MSTITPTVTHSTRRIFFEKDLQDRVESVLYPISLPTSDIEVEPDDDAQLKSDNLEGDGVKLSFIQIKLIFGLY